jgi:hypothetical protein
MITEVSSVLTQIATSDDTVEHRALAECTNSVLALASERGVMLMRMCGATDNRAAQMSLTLTLFRQRARESEAQVFEKSAIAEQMSFSWDQL